MKKSQPILRFRGRIERLGTTNDLSSLQQSGRYWRMVAFVDSLVRLRLFLEHNFNYIETMGMLSVARYMLELTVWLKLLERDTRYGLVYYRCIVEVGKARKKSMTASSGKSTNKRAKDSTKLAPGSWLDNTLDPFHSAAAVDSLFKRVDQLERQDRKKKKSKK